MFQYLLPNHDHRDMSDRQFRQLIGITHAALEALKDICNADPVYSQDEVREMAIEPLNQAYDHGIRLSNEEA